MINFAAIFVLGWFLGPRLKSLYEDIAPELRERFVETARSKLRVVRNKDAA